MLSLYAMNDQLLRYRGKDPEKLKQQRMAREKLESMSCQDLNNSQEHVQGQGQGQERGEVKSSHEVKSIKDNPDYHTPPNGVPVSDSDEPLFYKSEFSFLQDMINQSSILPRDFSNFIMKHLELSPLQYLMLVMSISPILTHASVAGGIANLNQTLSTFGLDANTVLSGGSNITLGDVAQKALVKFADGFPAFGVDLCKNATASTNGTANSCGQFYGLVNATTSNLNSTLSNSSLSSTPVRFMQGVFKSQNIVQSSGSGDSSLLKGVLNQIKAWLNFATLDNIKSHLNFLIKDLNITQLGNNNDNCTAFAYQKAFTGNDVIRICQTFKATIQKGGSSGNSPGTSRPPWRRGNGGGGGGGSYNPCSDTIMGSYKQTISGVVEFTGVDPSICQSFQRNYQAKYNSIFNTTLTTGNMTVINNHIDPGMSTDTKVLIGIGGVLGGAAIIAGGCWIYDCCTRFGYFSPENKQIRRQERERREQIALMRKQERENKARIRFIYDQTFLSFAEHFKSKDAAFKNSFAQRIFPIIAQYAEITFPEGLPMPIDVDPAPNDMEHDVDTKERNEVSRCVETSIEESQSSSQSHSLSMTANRVIQELSRESTPSNLGLCPGVDVSLIPGYVMERERQSNIELAAITVVPADQIKCKASDSPGLG